MKIPKRGLEADAILSRLESYERDDMPWRSGRTWAYVYDPGREAEDLARRLPRAAHYLGLEKAHAPCAR